MSTSSPPPSSVTTPAPASTVTMPSATFPTATNVPSPNGGGGDGDNLSGPGPSTSTVGLPRQTYCPLTPVTPVSPTRPGSANNSSAPAIDSLAVEFQFGDKLPWKQDLTAQTSFKLIGCITELVPVMAGMRSGHVGWWCPVSQPHSAKLEQGFTLARTHYWDPPTSPASDLASPPFSHRHVLFDPPNTPPSSQICRQPSLVSANWFHNDCATCPSGKPMIQSPDTSVDSRTWHLHGCIEVGDQTFCSWFDFKKNMTCLAADKMRELFPFVLTCEAMDKSRTTDQSVIARLLNSGVFDKHAGAGAGAGPAASDGKILPSSPADASADAAAGTGMGTMAMTALIVVPVVAIAFLAAAAIVYRRRQARFTGRLSNPHAPVRVRRASLTRMPAAAVVAVNYVEMSPPPASSPTTTPVKLPRVFPNLTLHAFPRAPAGPATSLDRDVSLQSLTDAWHSLFLALERSATTHARASLPADVAVARMRAARAEYMSAVMAHAWQVLRGHEAVPANAAVAELAMGMRDVLVRTARVYPGFRLAWPEVGREVRDEVASVYFEHEVEWQGAGKVVRGVVYPGWVDEDRGVVVVKAKVVV